MPDGWYFGRVSAVTNDSKGEIYVFHRNLKIDPIVVFNKDGKYLLSWGKPGSKPGEFQTVHAVATDSKGRVYVSDRENNRIQIFSPDGKFLKAWTHLGATQGIDITNKDEVWVVTHRNN